MVKVELNLVDFKGGNEELIVKCEKALRAAGRRWNTIKAFRMEALGNHDVLQTVYKYFNVRIK